MYNLRIPKLLKNGNKNKNFTIVLNDRSHRI